MTLASSSWREAGGILSGDGLVVIVVMLRGSVIDNLRWNSAGRSGVEGVEYTAQRRGYGVGVVFRDSVGDTTTPDRAAAVCVVVTVTSKRT